MTPQIRGRFGSASSFAFAATRYWLSVFPRVRHELHYWQSLAREIENPVLRHLALDAQRTKRRSLEGAVAFAAFAPRSAEYPTITALATYQVIFDYLDTLAEQPNPDPIRNGRQLNQALLAALQPHGTQVDYYAHHEQQGDSGYLEALVTACRAALAELPAYAVSEGPVRRATERIIAYQSLNHGDSSESHDAFAQWARAETQPDSGLSWWETGAAAGSSLAVLALISATAVPDLSAEEAAALDGAYYPWVGALHTLLDSLVDRPEDTTAAGQRSLIDYYSSPTEVASRLEMIAHEAVGRVAALPHAHNHAIILAAMSSFYLSDSHARTTDARLARERVLAAMGGLAAPTMLVMRLRHIGGILGRQ